ncbi:MAG: DUF4105 domain-containing protein [Fuerstiella sp.]|nr:DUF4105 domain-containing protein [Fuerstiella sp.]
MCHPDVMEASRFKTTSSQVAQLSLHGIMWLTVLLLIAWAVGAIYYFEFLPAPASDVLALMYLVTTATLMLRWPNRIKWLRVTMASVVVIYLLTLLQRPSNERNWAPDNAQLANVKIRGDDVLIDGFRHTVYRTETDADIHFRKFDFKLSQLEKVWFVVQRFTALEGIAHNFLTFGLQSADGPRYFSVSIEIRREQGESFSPIRGLYRQYELIYIVADERDEIGGRTVMRPDDQVFMFPCKASPEQVQQLFVEIAQRIQQLNDAPRFYHSLLNNCTNCIVRHTYTLTPKPINWLDPRIVLPGYADRFAFSNDLLSPEPDQTFSEFQTQCRIDQIARRAGISEDFSADIRVRFNGL